ncbi:MAG TPA: hypothetical protein VMV29_19845 [Ktedonobacterales bacterium]|nr:hypothetical protein [Ktedonobacterales bacterium]
MTFGEKPQYHVGQHIVSLVDGVAGQPPHLTIETVEHVSTRGDWTYHTLRWDGFLTDPLASRYQHLAHAAWLLQQGVTMSGGEITDMVTEYASLMREMEAAIAERKGPQP